MTPFCLPAIPEDLKTKVGEHLDVLKKTVDTGVEEFILGVAKDTEGEVI